MMHPIRQRQSCHNGETAMEMPSTRRAGEPQTGQCLGPLTEDLRRVLRTELLRNTCSAAGIARLFSMHRRTLNRHLHTEGLGFRQLANEVRFEIACELLANTDMALSQIAAVLRYSELSAFTRAFRRWSGQTPSAWRTSHPRVRKSRWSRKPRRLQPGPDSGGCPSPSSNRSHSGRAAGSKE
jgi:AraC-like DNA-binding protein